MGVFQRLERAVPDRVMEVLRPTYPRAALPWLLGSFSQTGEDRIVAFILDGLQVSHPTYLDIGAYHPFHLSNTALLYSGGSRGVNVEPDPDSFESFLRHRKGDTNLNIGVGPEAGTLTFFRMSAPTLSTFSEEAAIQAFNESGGRHRITETLEVEVRTPAALMREVGVPDFMNLDVEGIDLDIVETMSDWPGLPTIICVETIGYSERGRGVKVTEVADFLTNRGYMTFADTCINTVFVLGDRWDGR